MIDVNEETLSEKHLKTWMKITIGPQSTDAEDFDIDKLSVKISPLVPKWMRSAVVQSTVEEIDLVTLSFRNLQKEGVFGWVVLEDVVGIAGRHGLKPCTAEMFKRMCVGLNAGGWSKCSESRYLIPTSDKTTTIELDGCGQQVSIGVILQRREYFFVTQLYEFIFARSNG